MPAEIQKLVSGTGSIQRVGEIVGRPGISKVLLVCSPRWQDQLRPLFPPGIELDWLCPPPGLLELQQVPLGLEFDSVVAVGGGKTLDFAKAVIHQNRSTQKRLFIAVPTTAGSGSEATSFAVVYEATRKRSIETKDLLPDVVVLDHGLLQGLPAMQRAISGADAVSQCIESIWNVKSVPDSEAKAVEGLDLLREYLPAFVKGDEAVAEKVLLGAYCSGQAIAITRTTGPHALSYYLTAVHGVPHGQAVALFLPLFFLYNKEAETMPVLLRTIRAWNAEDGFEWSREFFRTLGLGLRFPDLGLNHVDVEALIASVNMERFANNPLPFDAEKLDTLIHKHLC